MGKKGLGNLSIKVAVGGETYEVLTLEQLYVHMLNQGVESLGSDVDQLLRNLKVAMPPECYSRLQDLMGQPTKRAWAEAWLKAKATPFQARMDAYNDNKADEQRQNKVGKCYWPDCP